VAATKATALALDQRNTSLERTSETHTGEQEKEYREKSDDNHEMTKTTTNASVNQELSKNLDRRNVALPLGSSAWDILKPHPDFREPS
jgi:hypothetical protein